ncbi:MAG TPA: PilW family protein [Reyranella sp.]|nr:PilW family protein [Reyranella sp.]
MLRLPPRSRQQGLSLIELMIAITLGLLVLAGLTTVFVTASESQRELQRSAQQIENGRYAIDTLTNDIHHAGYYGRFSAYSDPTAIPDPCITGNEAALTTAMSAPIQLYTAADQTSQPSLASTSCAAYGLTAANLQPGSDVLVIRRADTSSLRYPADGQLPTATTTDSTTTAAVYMQTNPKNVNVFFGTGAAANTLTTMTQKNGTAELARRYRVHIYFVAPCSMPAGTACAANDDGGTPVPTLKRLELTVVGGTRTFEVVPIAEGIQAFKVELGVDNSPSTANASTNRIGDGAPDLYLPNSTTSAITVADLANTVSTKLWLVARSPQATPNHVDSKTYAVATPAEVLGGGTVAGSGLAYGPYNDGYKRHAFFTEVRVVNMSSRRENP